MQKAGQFLLLFSIMLAPACAERPGPNQAIQDFISAYEIRKDIHCENALVVAEYTEAPRVRHFGIQAECTSFDGDLGSDRYFRIEYADLGGGWELRNIARVLASEMESMGVREPVQDRRAGLSEASSEALIPILVIVLPIVVAAVVFSLGVWVLRHRKRETVDRPAGAGISVAASEEKPGQSRSHWTVTPLK